LKDKSSERAKQISIHLCHSGQLMMAERDTKTENSFLMVQLTVRTGENFLQNKKKKMKTQLGINSESELSF